MPTVQSMLDQLKHQLQDILLLKTLIIIKALQHERHFSLVQILEVVLNFTFHLHIFLDLQSIKRLFGD